MFFWKCIDTVNLVILFIVFYWQEHGIKYGMHNIVKSFFTASKPNANESQSSTEEELAVSHLKRY